MHYLEAGIWDKRPLFLGQSRFSVESFDNVTVTSFVSPDCSSEVFLQAVGSANQTIHVNVYEFTSPVLAEALISAHQRGVDVRILVEGGPVGGITPEEKALIWTINQSRIKVYQMATVGDQKAPYRFDHAKYLVIDEHERDNDEMAALINHIAVAEGIPLEGRCADLESNKLEKIHNKGVIVDNRSVLVSSINWNSNSPNFNREAGVIIEHPAIAGYFKEVFEDDWQPIRPKASQNLDYLKIAGLVAIILCLAAVYIWRHRRM